MRLKIISWNIWFDSTDFDSICKFLKDNPADIIGIQEVSDDPSLDIISFMVNLGYNYVYTQAATANKHGKKYGNAIFSKYKLSNKQDFVLSKEKSRNAVSADIEINGSVLHIFTTHLIHDHQQSSELQTEQIKNLVSVLPKDKAIVMGDFNAMPESNTIKSIQSVLNNSDSTNQPTWTMDPAGCPECKINNLEIRLDYIFVTKDIKLITSKVMTAQGSDHLPVFAEVEI